MTRFKTEKELQDFLDNSLFCLCGRLLTGLHENNCKLISDQRKRFQKNKNSKIDNGCFN